MLDPRYGNICSLYSFIGHEQGVIIVEETIIIFSITKEHCNCYKFHLFINKLYMLAIIYNNVKGFIKFNGEM